MTPQGWIKDTLDRWPAGHHVAEGATHLAAALEEIARLRADASAASPSCDRCQSAHCCSVTGSAVPPLCVTDPDGSLPLWMPWTNADVQARVDPLHAEIDRLRAEAGRLVVPEFDANDALHFGQSFEEAGDLGKQAEFMRGWLASEFRAHSVPSSRVLKDGEAAVDAEEWAAMCDLGFDPEPCRLDHHGCCQEHNWFGEKPCPTAILQRLYALRTQATESGKAREVEV